MKKAIIYIAIAAIIVVIIILYKKMYKKNVIDFIVKNKHLSNADALKSFDIDYLKSWRDAIASSAQYFIYKDEGYDISTGQKLDSGN
jgi:hypothetical protein